MLVRDYRKPKETWTDGVVVQKLGPVTYHVQLNSESNLIWKRHIDQIRQCSADLDIKPVLESVDQGLYAAPPCVVPPSVVHTENPSIQPNIMENVGSTMGNSQSEPVTCPTVPSVDVASEPRYPKCVPKKPQRLIEQM